MKNRIILMYMILLFFILFGFLFNCNGQQNIAIKKSQKENFSILGKWEIVNRVYIDDRYPLSKKESMECSGNIVVFYEDSVVGSKDNCFYGMKCQKPNYKVQKVNTLIFFEGDTTYKKLYGITEDSLNIVITDCGGAPFEYIYFITENYITLGVDNYTFFLQRVDASRKKNISFEPSVGDTVRCKYRETSGECTGYIIQGTRKSGKVVHVNPVNKNVPLEIEEEKDKNKK